MTSHKYNISLTCYTAPLSGLIMISDTLVSQIFSPFMMCDVIYVTALLLFTSVRIPSPASNSFYKNDEQNVCKNQLFSIENTVGRNFLCLFLKAKHRVTVYGLYFGSIFFSNVLKLGPLCLVLEWSP